MHSLFLDDKCVPLLHDQRCTQLQRVAFIDRCICYSSCSKFIQRIYESLPKAVSFAYFLFYALFTK